MQRILLIGGPGTGKSTLINDLENRGFKVHHEISREVTARAQQQGIEQLFLTDPMAFSNQLLAGRIQQFVDAVPGINFYDRGIPDVPAYHKFTGDHIPENYLEASKNYKYDQVFHLAPWEEIYAQDSERYESFSQASAIDKALKNFYRGLGYDLITIPQTTVENRINFILDHVNLEA
ncbi:AAA family ATPase [Nonlabens ponticola]|uniref:ATPase n=1 Tax=Nonlabens ponticola TaxID=2496866 RepID=A0A3S9N114_9FLAO|nr:ATP-binding protein [Nonlabens ponticola]AZQ45215.1 ATPase [Nonlabens ponticola]